MFLFFSKYFILCSFSVLYWVRLFVFIFISYILWFHILWHEFIEYILFEKSTFELTQIIVIIVMA